MSTPTDEQAWSCIGCAHRMAAYGLGFPLIGRHGPAHRLFASDSNTSLASIDEFDRTRDLSHRRAGRVALVVRPSRSWDASQVSPMLRAGSQKQQ